VLLAGAAAAVLRSAVWRGVSAGVIAAAALAVLVVVRLTVLLAVNKALFLPMAVRRAGWPLPPQRPGWRTPRR
jgi:hypothetical protein